MTVRTRRPLLATVLAAAFVLGACGTAPEADPAAAGEASETSLDTAVDVDPDVEDGPGTEPPADEGSVTEAALQRMLDADPEVAASAHDHDHEDHAMPVHPNGIDPEAIVIPAIDVDADVIDLGLQDDGSMEVPSDFAQTGWFDRGPKPGRVGPAVIAGHVDSTRGPAVFFRLSELEPGDEIEVHGEDGELVTFAVRETQIHPKDDFPSEEVYAGTPGAELRLITCSGTFDAEERSYRDNTIVFAERIDA
jgi:LPXTG-site transpeptidase (sortase) family protein